MHCRCSRCSSYPAMPWSWLLQVPWSCCCRLRCNLRLHCFGGLCGYIDFLHLPLPFIFGMSLADAVYGLPLCMLCAAWSCYMAALCYAQHCRVLSSLPDLCRFSHMLFCGLVPLFVRPMLSQLQQKVVCVLPEWGPGGCRSRSGSAQGFVRSRARQQAALHWCWQIHNDLSARLVIGCGQQYSVCRNALQHVHCAAFKPPCTVLL